MKESGQLEEDGRGFIVLELLGKSLKDILQRRRKAFSLKTICQIGIQMVLTQNLYFQVKRIQDFHSLGYVHLDIKPDNILLSQDGRTLHLIDFSVSKTYICEGGEHIGLSKARNFVGNIVFASKNAFKRLG